MTGTVKECLLCQPSDLTFWRGDNLAVLLDPAPLVEGHALIYTSSHYPSAADIPGDVAAELDAVCDWLRVLYQKEFGAFTLFEHGRTGHCLRRSPEERICHHTHVHVVPLPGDLVGELTLGQRVGWRLWSDVARLADEIDGYVAVETATSGRYFYPVTRTLAPHFLRTRAAHLAGDPGRADWEQSVGWPSSRNMVTSARARLDGLLASAGQPGTTAATGRSDVTGQSDVDSAAS